MASKNIPVNGWPQLKDLEAVQPTLDRLDKIEAWKKTVKEETFTGSELTIDQALKLPARSLKTTIEALQDLHGYDHPWAGGSQKNKYNISALNNSSSAAGITSTVNSDGTLSLTAGTASEEFVSALSYQTANEPVPFTAGETYTFSIGTNKKQTSLVLQVLYRETSSSGWATLVNVQNVDSANFTMPSGTVYDLLIRLKVAVGNSITATTLYPMVCKSTESTDWMPYSNLCPISGRTEARVDTENEDSSESAYAVIQLGTTVYGADINWDTGVGTVDRVLADNSLLTVFRNNTAGTGTLASFNKTTNGYASRNAYTTSIFKPQTVSQWEALDADTILTDGGTGYCVICTDVPNQTQEQLQQWLTDNGAQICLYLATPTTIQLTPTQLQMLKGENHITLADGYGTIELKALTGANWS